MPTSAISILARSPLAHPPAFAALRPKRPAQDSTRPLETTTGCYSRTGEIPVAALARSIPKKTLFVGRLLVAASYSTSGSAQLGELCWNLLVMGKQNMAGLPARRHFENCVSPAKTQAISSLCLSESRDTIPHILFCSIPGGRESESTQFLHERRSVIIPASSVHFLQQTQQHLTARFIANNEKSPEKV